MLLSEIKTYLIDMLTLIDEWCSKNNVSYFLMYGTLLGAVRHKGFIPWDDDVDIAMPRKDYEKFLREFKSKDGRYKVVDVSNTDGYYLQFAKVVDTTTFLKERMCHTIDIGVYIDIFPVDYLGNDILQAKKLISKLKPYRNILSAKLLPSHKKRSNWRNILAKIVALIPISLKGLITRIDSLSREFEFQTTSQYVGIICFNIYSKKEIMPFTWFQNIVKIEFEGHLFNVPKEYDKILTHFYGDYMKLPPVEERNTHHDYEVYKII